VAAHNRVHPEEADCRMKPTRCAVAACATFLVAAAHAETPPAEASALRSWLDAGRYRDWSHESRQHRSTGLHPEAVVTYVNAPLHDSLAAAAREHPAGAAAVKELYRGGRLSGFAVAIKTEARSAVGRGWYWYEVTSLDAEAKPVAAANGVPLCLGCHLTGRDFVLTPFPLR
jgi:hypothetical protein